MNICLQANFYVQFYVKFVMNVEQYLLRSR